ncbi:MAG TPA: flagellin [Vicinamibacterales bacterium]|jgi:flagellar hook-associated protein 3 FlgL|nr:flagellin [Vicinamibacterales bacterium]
MRVIFDLMRDGLSAINTAANQFAKAQQEVATGRRINTVSDDPLGASQAIGEHATMATIDAYTATSNSASAKLSATDNVLAGIVDKLSSAIVTGTSARGSTVDQTARDSAAAAIRGLRDSLVTDFNTTFNGTYLFSGTAVDQPPYAQVDGTWTYQGNSDTTQVEVQHGQLVSTTVNGQAVAQGSDTTDVFTTLDQLADAIESGDDDAITNGLSALDRAFDRTLQAQGRLGAAENTVDDATSRLQALRQAADTRRSTLEDANLAESATKMSQASTAYQAALGAVSSAERQSLLDYLQ